jgi:hypothetical protein
MRPPPDPPEIHLYKPPPLGHAAGVMRKKLLPFLLAPLLLAGCATFTNLTAQRQLRNPNNLYPVEVAFGTEFYPMRPTLLMRNRWEGLVPVPPGTNLIHYRYKFDFKYNAVGKPPQTDSLISREYTLQILDR